MYMFSISDSHRCRPMQAYKTSVQQLLPSWASAMGDPQEATAERHLGELQFNIEATGCFGLSQLSVSLAMVPNKSLKQ